MFCRGLAFVSSIALASVAWSQAMPTSLDRLDLLPRQGTSDAAIAPIWNQLFLFSLPDEFKTVSAGVVRKGRFEQQSILAKESPARWTQKITVAGDEALAFSGIVYPKKMVDDFVARTKKNCPEGFSTLPLNGVFVGSYDTVVAVVGCGSTGGQSEAVMQMVIKGGMDMYTLDWIVRGPPVRGPMKLDESEWTERIRRLAPVRVCAIVANEKPPYPSCLRRR